MISPTDILSGKILIVDDREANVTLLEQMLRGAKYTSIASTMDPTQVCELHLIHHYDLILLDLQMPDMDGFQVMENLKEIEKDSYLRQVATELVPLASMMFRAPDGEPLPPTTVFPDPTPHED